MYYILLAWITLSTAALPPPNKCTANDVAVCMRTYMDTNADDMVDAAEWNQFSLYHECAPMIERVGGSWIVSQCDKNGNNMLDITDLTARGTCVSWGMWEHMCDLCTGCAAHLAK